MSIQGNNEIEIVLEKKTKSKIKLPASYKVIFYNDDFTTFEFVIEVLQMIFQKSKLAAHVLTHQIHKDGSAVVGIYSKEIALSKQHEVLSLAKQFNYPLVCKVEKE